MDEPGERDATPDESTADVPQCYCQLDGVLALLSRRYAMQVVCLVGAIGPARYGEIEAAFGDVSSSTLSARLDEQVEAGLLEREQYAEIPPRVEYELSERGEELRTRLDPLLKWAAKRDADEDSRSC